jgi:hypothetical protein
VSRDSVPSADAVPALVDRPPVRRVGCGNSFMQPVEALLRVRVAWDEETSVHHAATA